MISKAAFPVAIALMLTNAAFNVAGKPSPVQVLIHQYELMGGRQ